MIDCFILQNSLFFCKSQPTAMNASCVPSLPTLILIFLDAPGPDSLPPFAFCHHGLHPLALNFIALPLLFLYYGLFLN